MAGVLSPGPGSLRTEQTWNLGLFDWNPQTLFPELMSKRMNEYPSWSWSS